MTVFDEPRTVTPPPGFEAPTANGTAPAEEAPWPTLDPVARHGLPGEVVAAIEPHTEADPVAMLVSVLVGFGNALNSGPHARVGGAQHPARINAVIIGSTAKARKGTSWRDVRPVLEAADPEWARHRHVDGLSSGEGLIGAVADPVMDAAGKVVSAGITDKRLLVVEEEFSRVLAVAKRDGSTITPVIRSAFDNGVLRVLTKQRQQATGAHISILGHITAEELRRMLTETDIANGLANRFLLVCARRGPLLPSGGNLDDQVVHDLGSRMSTALATARTIGTMRRSPDAEALWGQLYTEMAEDDPRGLLGAIVARADAHTLRLSVAYAAMDTSRVIEVDHVRAAWALWSYCRASASYVFGDAEGDEVADKLLAGLRRAGEAGLDFKAQSALFSRHVDAKRLASARSLLERRGKAVTTEEETGGRPRNVTRCELRATKGGAA